MEIRQLNTFRMVATLLSFSRAATALNYVQSSVTTQIQQLEEELGVRLFDRLGKHIALTDAGKRLYLYAERILNLTEEARYAVAEGEMFTGTVTIGAPETLCTYRLPAVLQEFRQRFPQARLTFRPESFLDLRHCVSEGTIDVAFIMEEPVYSTSLQVEPLIQENVIMLASPEHPLARQPIIRGRDLEGVQCLLTEKGCPYRSVFEHALNEEHISAVMDLEFVSVEAIKQCVIAGMGIALLPEITVAAEIVQGRLQALQWGEHRFHITTQMLWHKEKWLSPAIRAFIETAREVMAPAAPVV